MATAPTAGTANNVFECRINYILCNGGRCRQNSGQHSSGGTNSGWKIEIIYVTRPADLQTCRHADFNLHSLCGDIGIPDVGLIYGYTRANNGAKETLKYQLTTTQRILSVNNYYCRYIDRKNYGFWTQWRKRYEGRQISRRGTAVV